MTTDKDKKKTSYIRDVSGGARIPSDVLSILHKVSSSRSNLITGPMALYGLGTSGAYFIDNSLAYVSGQITYVWRSTAEIIKFEYDCVEVNFSKEFLDACSKRSGVHAIDQGGTYEMPLPDWMQPESVAVYGTAAYILAKAKWPELDEGDDWTILGTDSHYMASDTGWDYSRYFLAGHPDRASKIRMQIEGLEKQKPVKVDRVRFSGIALEAIYLMMEMGPVETIFYDKFAEFRSENLGSIYVPSCPPTDTAPLSTLTGEEG